jgi:hypothetical protein
MEQQKADTLKNSIADPGPHILGGCMLVRIKVKSWIRIHIRIKVKSRIRIRIQVYGGSR